MVIRVLHCVYSMDRGGVETTLMNIFRKIDRKKVVFDFLVSTDKECAYDAEIRKLGGKIYSVPTRNQGIIKQKTALKKFFNEHQDYKIFHQHVSSLSDINAIKAAYNAKVPVRIIHSRNTKEGGSKIHNCLHKINQKKIDKYATHWFACSELAAEWLYGKDNLKDHSYKIINNGIDTNKFRFNETIREKIRREENVCDKKVYINVGRLHPQKNHTFLLKIFDEIQKKENNAVLWLVGEGALRKEIENKIREMNLEQKVFLKGVRSNVEELLQAADVFLMPSLYEGLPGSIIEAQGAGLPCILSDTITKEVAITDLVKFISLNKNEKEWTKIILNLNNTERKDTSNLLIEKGYDMNTIAKNLQEMYLQFYQTL